MESGRAAPLFRLHRRVRSLPNDLNPGSGDQRDRSDNRIRQLMTAGARHRNGDDRTVGLEPWVYGQRFRRDVTTQLCALQRQLDHIDERIGH